MRVAIVYNNPYGGTGRIVYDVARRLKERHDVTLVTLTPPGIGMAELESLVPQRPAIFRGLPSPPNLLGRLYPLFMLGGLHRLQAAYRRVADRLNAEFDVALVFPCIVTPAPLLLKYTTLPTVLYMGEGLRSYLEPTIWRPNAHTGRRLGRISVFLDHYDPLRALQNRVFQHLDVASARRASRVLAYSYYSREMLYRNYQINAQVNYPGVDTTVFTAGDGTLRQHEVLSVGHLWPTKGHDFVVEALAHIPQPTRPALVIAGDIANQTERAYLCNLAARRQVQIRFESSRIQADIVHRYQRAKLVAFAPVLEPLGFAPLEAMACSTPVIGVKEAGVRETICDGEGGYLVDRDPQAFAAAISKLLADDRLRNEQGQRGREYVLRNWAWEHSIDRLDQELLKAAGMSSAMKSAIC